MGPHRDEEGEPITGGKGGVNRRAPLMASVALAVDVRVETQEVKEKHLYDNELSACSCC